MACAWLSSIAPGASTFKASAITKSSHIPLHKWALDFHLFAASRKGISAHQTHRMLGMRAIKGAEGKRLTCARPRSVGLFGSLGLMTRHSESESSYCVIRRPSLGA